MNQQRTTTPTLTWLHKTSNSPQKHSPNSATVYNLPDSAHKVIYSKQPSPEKRKVASNSPNPRNPALNTPLPSSCIPLKKKKRTAHTPRRPASTTPSCRHPAFADSWPRARSRLAPTRTTTTSVDYSSCCFLLARAAAAAVGAWISWLSRGVAGRRWNASCSKGEFKENQRPVGSFTRCAPARRCCV